MVNLISCNLLSRLSRARRVVENAFGILASRFEVYRSPMRFKLTTIRSVVLATVVLHNYLRHRYSTSYTPEGSLDVEDTGTATIRLGSWRSMAQPEGIEDLTSCPGNAPTTAKNIRDGYRQYFNNEGRVSWQEKAMLMH